MIANRVKIVKWFLISSACLFCSVVSVRGDAAQLYNDGTAAMGSQQYDVAIKAYDALVKGYPTFQYIDDVRLQLGQAYLYAGKFPEAVAALAPEIVSRSALLRMNVSPSAVAVRPRTQNTAPKPQKNKTVSRTTRSS